MQAIDQSRGSSFRSVVLAEDLFEPADLAGGSSPSKSRVGLGVLLLAALGWVVAAPSAPALIFLVGCLVACVGWGD